MELEGSKTQANLMSAFAGESMASNKYRYFGEKAREDGYEQIGAMFDETASNEKEHAKIWYELLNGEIKHTLDNLNTAAGGEHFEWTDMYKDYAKVAKEEGFDNIASLFEMVAGIEHQHEERFRKLASNIEEGIVFDRDGDAIWICRNCGYVVIGPKAPKVCPVCKHTQGFFELKAQNY